MAPLLLFPQILFSGALFPIDSIRDTFRPVATVLPLTYASDTLHSGPLPG